ncbi:MAG: transporter, partial [Nocardioidaceae bacterium]|nr:transporter [Nocardioidaceae bacterium]
VLFALWIPLELKLHDPLVDLRQVKNRSVLTADASGFLISVAMYLLLPIIVEFVQVPSSNGYGFGTSVVVSGLVLVPLSVGSFAASRLLVPYEKRFGARSMIPLGSLVLAAAAVFFCIQHNALWEAFLAMGIGGLAIGFTTGAMPGFIVRAVPSSEVGSATGFYQVVRGIGLSLGSALSAAVLLAHTPDGEALPLLSGFRVVLIIAASLCVLTAIISFVLPGREPKNAMNATENDEVDELMQEEAEIGGAGIVG